MSKIVFIPIVVVALGVVALLVFNFTQKTDLLGKLHSLGYGYTVEIKEIAHKGYTSRSILAQDDARRMRVQTINNVEQDKVGEILAELTAPVLDAEKDIAVFDPYTRQEATLSVPEEFKPLKKETTIRGQTVPYYLAHANIIFSMMVYSEVEVMYRGLFATYFCDNDKTAYKLEIYYPIFEEFDEEKALHLFSSLYCR